LPEHELPAVKQFRVDKPRSNAFQAHWLDVPHPVRLEARD